MLQIAVVCALAEELDPFRDLANAGRIQLIHSGVGKVNAAIAAMRAIRRGASHIVVAGVAGSINASLTLGDTIVVDEAVQHDVDVRALGFDAGTIPFAARSRWSADPRLVKGFRSAARSLGIRTRSGRILTGDRFVAQLSEAKQLRLRFRGSCVDMETAAVAQVCEQQLVSWGAIRTISDNANENAPVDFPAFLRACAEKAALIVESFLDESAREASVH